MTRLSETQFAVLTAACQHPDRQVLPFPEHLNLRGGSVNKVVDSLLAKGLIAEVPQQPGQKLWRDGHGTTLIATDAAFVALGMIAPDPDGCEPEITGRYDEDDIPGTEDPGCFDATPAAESAETSDAGLKADVALAEAAVAPPAEPAKRLTRADTKQAKMITMLRDPAGATIDDIVAATGWQKHTVRGAMAGALKKKLGLTITSEKVDGRGRVYRVEDGAAAAPASID